LLTREPRLRRRGKGFRPGASATIIPGVSLKSGWKGSFEEVYFLARGPRSALSTKELQPAAGNRKQPPRADDDGGAVRIFPGGDPDDSTA